MRPVDEQQQFDELNANRRIKLAPKKVFETSLNDPYDPIGKSMRHIHLSSHKKRLRVDFCFRRKGA